MKTVELLEENGFKVEYNNGTWKVFQYEENFRVYTFYGNYTDYGLTTLAREQGLK